MVDSGEIEAELPQLHSGAVGQRDLASEIDDIKRRLREGDRTHSTFRTRHEEHERELIRLRGELALSVEKLGRQIESAAQAIELRISGVAHHLERADIESRRSVETKIVETSGAINASATAIRDELAPRATVRRIASWVAAVLVVVGSPLASAYYFQSTVSIRLALIEQRLQAIEAARPAKP